MKRELTVRIFQPGIHNEAILHMIALSNVRDNDDRLKLTIPEIGEILQRRKDSLNHEMFNWGIHENTIDITEDNGKSFTLSISEVEVSELVYEND